MELTKITQYQLYVLEELAKPDPVFIEAVPESGQLPPLVSGGLLECIDEPRGMTWPGVYAITSAGRAYLAQHAAPIGEW